MLPCGQHTHRERWTVSSNFWYVQQLSHTHTHTLSQTLSHTHTIAPLSYSKQILKDLHSNTRWMFYVPINKGAHHPSDHTFPWFSHTDKHRNTSGAYWCSHAAREPWCTNTSDLPNPHSADRWGNSNWVSQRVNQQAAPGWPTVRL